MYRTLLLLAFLSSAAAQLIPLINYQPQATPQFTSPPNGHHPLDLTFSSPPVRHAEPVAYPAPVNEQIDNDTTPPPPALFRTALTIEKPVAQVFSSGQARSFAQSQQMPTQSQQIGGAFTSTGVQQPLIGLQNQQLGSAFTSPQLQQPLIQNQQLGLAFSPANAVSSMTFVGGQGVNYSF